VITVFGQTQLGQAQRGQAQFGAGVADESSALIADAVLVIGARRHLDAARVPADRALALGPLVPALDAVALLREKDPDAPVVVLASGDPGFFGIVRVLAKRFGADALDVRPGISSIAHAFARLGVPWDDAVAVSAHGRDPRRAFNICRSQPKVAVLTAPGAGPAEIGAALAAMPGLHRRLIVAADLGGPAESLVELTPAETAARDWPAVNVVLSLADAAPPIAEVMRGVAGYEGAPEGGWALPEEAFAHRDAMLTKAEVRAFTLARLGPRLGELVWDVGAGSGSVAVECARLGAAAVAIERDADGVERIRANAGAHGVAHAVAVVHGRAPEALTELPDPDAVFVGGGGADLAEVVALAASRARRTVVVTLATLDRVPEARRALLDAGLSVEGVQLQANRLAPLPGEVTRLAATNPVFVLWGIRPAAPTVSQGVPK
jgi:precorrin-6Y C5,15-methyltransferase (decarboxylating)